MAPRFRNRPPTACSPALVFSLCRFADGSRGRATGEARGDRLLSHDGKQFEYDEHGNRTAEESAGSRGERTEYRYGPDNELIEVWERDKPDGRVTRFGYDALGRRVWKESAQIRELMATSRAMKRTEFLWNGDVLLAESRDPKDPLAIVYVYEPGSFRPLAQVKRRPQETWSTNVYHYHLDHLGTPQEMTDA